MITRIVTIKAMQQVNRDTPAQHEDASDLLASAGFIDLQLNGCGGVLLNSDTSS